VRSVDLAIYADSLAAEAATLAARLERARGRLRHAALEQEARRALPPDVISRLEALGVLATDRRPADDTAEVVDAQESLNAVERLQTWVERQLYAAAERRPPTDAEQGFGNPSPGRVLVGRADRPPEEARSLAKKEVAA
jgi:hypothetical protein